MNIEEQNTRFAALDDKINDLAAQLTQFANDMKAALAAPNGGQAAPQAVPEPVEGPARRNVTEEALGSTPVVVELDPISEAVTARLEEEHNKRFAKIEEKLRSLRGYEEHMIEDLSRYAQMSFPEKFKIPDFTKYDRTEDPKIHLKYYLNRMVRYAQNVPLMVQTFQESLTGPALQWYVLSEPEKFEKWEELAEAFILQYKYNSEIAPTREMLTRTEKKRSESFRAFAQRWRTLAAQVRPQLSEKELLDLFLRALPSDFYLKLVGSGCSTFSQLVDVGERIEGAMHDGRLSEGTSRKVLNRKEKDVEIAYVQAPIVTRPPASSSQGLPMF
ncbi:uncharacterized protein LOC115689043 [Syzygium oleosum]|uniref:uncharacterized protein LOC115689043 n=1 Tax=Syzygium oleosum TaxID=219896 RepID=UPI0011D25D6B|nr:uncharacterized protein LOC115689043 [Syzygium oleosum]